MNVYVYITKTLNAGKSFANKFIGYSYTPIIASTGEELLDLLKKEKQPVILFDSKNKGVSKDIQNISRLLQEKDIKPIIVGNERDKNNYGRVTFIPWDSSSQTQDAVNGILRKRKYRREKEERSDTIEREKKSFYDTVMESGQFEKKGEKATDSAREVVKITKKLRNHKCTSVLDIGCGYGRMSNPLAKIGFEVVGIDISKKSLEKAESRKRAPYNPIYQNVSMLRIQKHYANKSFDAALLLWNTISDAKNNWGQVINQIHYILKLKGILLLDIPDKADLPDEVVEGTKYEEEVTETQTYKGYVPNNLAYFLAFIEDYGFKVNLEEISYGRNSYLVTAVKARKTRGIEK